MKIAITDDIPAERDNLRKLAESCFEEAGYPVADTVLFENGEALLAHFAPGQYDVLFLDIYMPGRNGIDTAFRIRQMDENVKIIFITTSNDFAAESYRVRADYYLQKPYSRSELMTAIKQLELGDIQARTLLTLPDGQNVLLGAITHTTFSGHYVTIHRRTGTPVQVRCAQGKFEKLLLPYRGFALCTKGVIVNFAAVARLESDCFYLWDGAAVPISRRRSGEVRQAYNDYLIQTMRGGGKA